jgi:hypothetical protein
MRVCITSDQFSCQREQRGSGNTSRTKRGQFPAEVGVNLRSSMLCSNYQAAIVAVQGSKQAPANTYMNFTLNDLHAM